MFRDLRIRLRGLEIKHLKAHNFVWQGCFFFHSYLANFHRFVILCIMLRYTKWEDWSLTITRCPVSLSWFNLLEHEKVRGNFQTTSAASCKNTIAFHFNYFSLCALYIKWLKLNVELKSKSCVIWRPRKHFRIWTIFSNRPEDERRSQLIWLNFLENQIVGVKLTRPN